MLNCIKACVPIILLDPQGDINGASMPATRVYRSLDIS
jgi:hypothetical protein